MLIKIIFIYLIPIIILPFFFKLKKLENQELTQKIEQIITISNLKVKAIYSADASERTTHSNACVAGFGNTKKIIIFDTMLNGNYSNDEICAVLAHEIGHIKHKHILKMIAISAFETLIMLIILLFLLSNIKLYNAFNIPQLLFAGLPIGLIVFNSLGFLLNAISNTISRYFEKQADDYSVKIMGSAKPLIATFKYFIERDLANIHIHPLYEFLHLSHPSLLHRIKRLQKK